MKKFIASILTLSMVFSVGTTAFASQENIDADKETAILFEEVDKDMIAFDETVKAADSLSDIDSSMLVGKAVRSQSVLENGEVQTTVEDTEPYKIVYYEDGTVGKFYTIHSEVNLDSVYSDEALTRGTQHDSIYVGNVQLAGFLFYNS